MRFVKEVVVHPGAVAVVPLLNESELVLVEQFRAAVGEVLVEVPAGTLENESPEECAARELEEETGYSAGSLKKIGEFYLAPGYSTELMHVYLAKNLRKTEGRNMPDEKISVITCGLEEAFEMVRSGRIRDAKSIAALSLARMFNERG
ncbi:ADP-ribose pyrophosphatase [Candidatus Caldarchaeum subterraneum]|uniref:ADP-ribose pyrophosphatase n=1 Tax=Caldiarchaeum subterraneum TaxID=311458 RepID=E6N7Y9_CALS0|nr:ADP-ribose pyrophosphatase [Candidatus Caldarchaeum subterraneum]BAJ51180.1 ADP-ribose pyrophosphatase [Candidatus Caldarchaeum subterraneum]